MTLRFLVVYYICLIFQYQISVLGFGDENCDGQVFEEWQQPNRRFGRSLMVNIDTWPNGQIAYKFDKWENGSEIFSRAQKRVIERAMVLIESVSCVDFIETDNQRPSAFVNITSRSCEIGEDCNIKCNSAVGKVRNNKLNLGVSRCVAQSPVLHELMHTLGFAHEHQRPDRNKYVNVNCNNLVNDHGCRGTTNEVNFKKLTGPIIKDLIDSPYDYRSIMHYGPHWESSLIITGSNPKYEEAGSPKIGRGESLTSTDIERINWAYGCSGFCGERTYILSNTRNIQIFHGHQFSDVDFGGQDLLNFAHRKAAYLDGFIYAVGYRDVVRLDFKNMLAEKMINGPEKFFVALGGVDGTILGCDKKQCWFKSTDDGVWEKGEELPVDARNAQGIVFQGALHILGGYSSKAHMRVTPREAIKLGAELNVVRYNSAGVAVFKNELYICGGYEKWDSVKSCEKWAYQRQWTLIKAMNTNREFMHLAVVDGYLYALGGRKNGRGQDKTYKEIEWYDRNTNRWTTLTNPVLPIASTPSDISSIRVPYCYD